MKKVSMYALAAIAASAFGLVVSKPANAGDVRFSIHVGIPVVARPAAVVYRPVVVPAPVRHVHHVHRHPHHRHLHRHRHPVGHVRAGLHAPAKPIVRVGVYARLR